MKEERLEEQNHRCLFHDLVTVCSAPGVSSWTDGDCRLVSSALCVLSELPSICSPEGEAGTLPDGQMDGQIAFYCHCTKMYKGVTAVRFCVCVNKNIIGSKRWSQR